MKLRWFMFALLTIFLLGDSLSAAAITRHAGEMASALPDWGTLSVYGVGMLGATLATGALTLIDQAKRLDPDGKVPVIVELLSQTNEVLDDMLFREGNLPTGHRTTIRTGLPTVYWRMLNQGIPPSKSQTAQVDENAGMLEAWSEVDKDLALLNGNVSASGSRKRAPSSRR
jgi:hypothetical protein